MNESDALGSVITALTSNPELMRGITDAFKNSAQSSGGTGSLPDVLSALSGKSETDGGKKDEKSEEGEGKEAESTETGASAPVFSPEIMSKLPAILSALGGSSAFTGAHAKKGEEAKREALLRALKPYLSDSRAEAIDRILQLSRLGELLRTR